MSPNEAFMGFYTLLLGLGLATLLTRLRTYCGASSR